jgi:hypothetical protein
MANTVLYSSIDLAQVMARNSAARDIVTGFAAATPALATMWQQIEGALADSSSLATDVTRLSGQLRAARLDRANLLAAMRATLAADSDGETDPLSYLRDELHHAQDAAAGRAGASDG